jgi:hypothetical protein
MSNRHRASFLIASPNPRMRSISNCLRHQLKPALPKCRKSGSGVNEVTLRAMFRTVQEWTHRPETGRKKLANP